MLSGFKKADVLKYSNDTGQSESESELLYAWQLTATRREPHRKCCLHVFSIVLCLFLNNYSIDLLVFICSGNVFKEPLLSSDVYSENFQAFSGHITIFNPCMASRHHTFLSVFL
jgi:hypothetical protein